MGKFAAGMRCGRMRRNLVPKARRIAKEGRALLRAARSKAQDAAMRYPQNGFTITRMTMTIISNVGTSLTIRQ
jgi:hypothetical protein